MLPCQKQSTMRLYSVLTFRAALHAGYSASAFRPTPVMREEVARSLLPNSIPGHHSHSIQLHCEITKPMSNHSIMPPTDALSGRLFVCPSAVAQIIDFHAVTNQAESHVIDIRSIACDLLCSI